jgi:serine/threonine protein kinase/WD40 repeat protein
MAEWNPRANDIFVRAAEIDPPDEQRRFLEQECGDDAELQAQVESLLSAGGRIGSFLEKPAAPALAAVGGTAAYAPLTEGPNTVIGPYRLMEQIGEGGFGLVFVAEQQAPVRRKVALKVIKPGMDTRDVIARFEAERQALALMDHPNIAKVLDAGATESGRPYFVMELVKGIPLTDYCDRNQLTPRERLGLFVGVCQAVQHAHTKGVIHRDLKPSNILVTLHDGTPVVKVIDFGVAKAIGQHLTDKTIYTRFNQMIGTPLYMSPEQAEMSGLDIDTRSDIYSLAVLLYELLTGTTPFDSERLKKAAFDEIRRIIREEEPPRPSTRLSTLGAKLPTVSARRKMEPGKLSALVRGDLDWIVMKGLDKDRTRRYETASAFASDVQRYLREEPVEARPPSASYRLRKFLKRNRGPAIAVTLVSLTLVAGIVGTTLGLIHATAEHADALSALRDKEEALAGAQRSKRDAQYQLFQALLHQARASRKSGQVGQRFETLKAVKQAAVIARELRLPAADLDDLRTEAIAALALPDLEVAREWDGWPADTMGLDYDDSLERYVRLHKQGEVAVCRLTAGGEEVTARFQVKGERPFRGPWLSRDGRHVLIAHGRQPGGSNSTSRAFCVWRLDGPKPKLVLDREATQYEHAVSFRPGGRQVTVGHLDKSVGVYDLDTGQCIRSLPLDAQDDQPLDAQDDQPHNVAFHPSPADGRLAVACGNAVRIFDVDRGKELAPLRHPPQVIWTTGLAWHPDGRRLATACGDCKIYLWDVETAAQRTLPWEGHTCAGISLAFNHAGDRLVSHDWTGRTRLWDAVTGRLLLTSSDFIGNRFNRDDTLLGNGWSGSKVRLNRVAAGQDLRVLRRAKAEPKEQIAWPVLDADGRILAATTPYTSLSFFDFASGEELASVAPSRPTGIGPLRFHPRHGWVIWMATPGVTVDTAFWPCRPDPHQPNLLRIGPPRRVVSSSHAGADLSADGRILVVPNGHKGGLMLHLDEPGKEIPLGPQYDVRSVAVSPDGRWVVTCSHWSDPHSRNVRIWDATTGKHVHNLLLGVETGLDAGPVAVFSPKSRWLATYSPQLGCKLWEVETWREVRHLGGAGCAFSPDSRLVAIGEKHGPIRLVLVETGREVARLTPPEPCWHYPVCFSPDGSHLVATHIELKGIYVWDLRQIREQLAGLGLDWEAPPYPPAAPRPPPLRVEIVKE